MSSWRCISWNVNGIRAISTKGFFPWLENSSADIVALQETKAHVEQLGPEFFPSAYHHVFASAEKKGYSGVAIYSRQKPLASWTLGNDLFDREGRVLFADFGDFVLCNAYFPNSQEERARLSYKLAFCSALENKLDELRSAGRSLVICGDYNVAHRPIDLSYPERNENSPGYYLEEREWMESFIQKGYIDTFRHFYPTLSEAYTWWSYRTRARERNIGWRIDYFCVDQSLVPSLHSASILSGIIGSDHCPIELDFS